MSTVCAGTSRAVCRSLIDDHLQRPASDPLTIDKFEAAPVGEESE